MLFIMVMKRWLRSTCILVILSGCSNSTTGLNPGSLPVTEARGVLFTTDWDKLNTILAPYYYIQDADISERRDSIATSFTSQELTRIERTADAIEFWNLPDTLPVVPGEMIEPNSGRNTIRITTGLKDHTITWDGVLTSEFGGRVYTLADTIWSVLRERPEVQQLPPRVMRD